MALYVIVLNIIQILAHFGIAVQAFRLALGKKTDNFYWLSGHFFCLFLVDIVVILFNGFGFGAIFNNPSLANALGYEMRRGFYMLGDICLAFFVVRTFFQNRKSPFALFLGIAILWGVSACALYFLQPPFLIPSNILTFLWASFVAFGAYRQVSHDRAIEDWVKARYLLVSAGALFMISAPVDNFITLTTTGKIGVLSPVTNIFLIVAVALFYLAWMMPEWFRKYMNRNYVQPENVDDLSEEEIMKKLGGAAA